MRSIKIYIGNILKKINLVDDWRCAWKWISVNSMVAAGAVQGAWMQVPYDMKMNIDSRLISGITIALLIMGVIGRLVKQGADDNATDTKS